MDAEELKKLVLQRVAAELVGGLRHDECRKLAEEGVAKMLLDTLEHDYELSRQVHEQVRKRGTAAVAEYLAEPQVEELIRSKARAACDTFISMFHVAFVRTLFEAAGVKRGERYGHPPIARAMIDLLKQLELPKEK